MRDEETRFLKKKIIVQIAFLCSILQVLKELLNMKEKEGMGRIKNLTR